MGYIYSIAAEVIAVLSQPVLPALTQIQANKPLTESLMSLLEKDEWVTRAWTYQETVNARLLFITCDGADTIIIHAMRLINHVGLALMKLPIPPLERRAQRPGLDALEDLVDYLTAGAGERSAMQVMAKMDRRTQQMPDDHFYAMIGAISQTRSSALGVNNASEAFMQVCENKGDFSFIFSAAQRESSSGRRWRPARGEIPAILQWDTWGPRQAGRITSDGLRLESVAKLGIGDLTVASKKFIRTWLNQTTLLPDGANDDLPKWMHVILDALRRMGFAGSGECLTTPAGLFFPYGFIYASEVRFIVVSSSLQWRFGCPGMLCYEPGHERLYTAGVLVGCVDHFPLTAETLGS